MVFNGELEGRGKKGKKRKKGKKGKKERGGIHDFRFRGRGKYRSSGSYCHGNHLGLRCVGESASYAYTRIHTHTHMHILDTLS